MEPEVRQCWEPLQLLRDVQMRNLRGLRDTGETILFRRMRTSGGMDPDARTAVEGGRNMFAGLMRYISKGYAFVICTEITDTNYMEIAIYTNGTVVSVLQIVSSAVITCGDDAIMNEDEDDDNAED